MARIAAQLVHKEAKCPIEVYNNYYLPGYVNHKSLVIACSYSGNTEETIAAMEQALAKGARVCVVTSGGTMLEMAKAKGLDHIVIPGGNPPRTMLAYSLVQQFFLLASLRDHRRWLRRRDQRQQRSMLER